MIIMNEKAQNTNRTTLDIYFKPASKTDDEIFADFIKSQEGKYINKEGDKFVVSRIIKGERKVFNQFTSYEYAAEYEHNLILNGWHDLFLPNSISYGKYIRNIDGKYYVLRKIEGGKIKYGPYNKLIEALLKREELIDNNWGVDEEMNFHKKGKFGKYISYSFGNFVITKKIDGQICNFGCFDTIDDATLARDILVENNWDDTKVPESLYSWKFFTRYHPLTKSYEIYNLIGIDLVFFGLFKTSELAKKALKILIKNNWDSSFVPLEYYHEDSNIIEFNRPNGNEYYSVVRRINDGNVPIASFDNRDEAVAFRDDMLLNNWELEEEEEQQFDTYIFIKGDSYTVKNNGEVFGVFDRICDAQDFVIECIRNNWWTSDIYYT